MTNQPNGDSKVHVVTLILLSRCVHITYASQSSCHSTDTSSLSVRFKAHVASLPRLSWRVHSKYTSRLSLDWHVVYIGPLSWKRSDYTVLVSRVGFNLINVKHLADIEALKNAQTVCGKTKTLSLRVILESNAWIKRGNHIIWRRLFVDHAEFYSIHLRAATINCLPASWNSMR